MVHSQNALFWNIGKMDNNFFLERVGYGIEGKIQKHYST
jgi:hypothetical protein